ncbi:hypothetical protein KXX16_008289 [Aspergillus fumigatus]|nr:hypothetical protein CNMCM8057_002281 [Aspergillus fumigatus]KAF4288177.1 hypothetical protein CNMCM8689_006458 [Aspergillus fumigatus]KAH1390984.1 hypothetical protein KXX49_002585 [Aspergillus fumigatus]KAH1466283.1 hypothetical protein KXX58_005408 [Aspergillus fumigatus]KAH1655250.1 hypothetical protein KXX16_008289 [Aspergillus fumigatus]
MQEWTTRGHAISRLQVQGLLPSGQQGRSIAIIIAKGPYNSQDKHPTSPLLLPLHQRGRRNNSYPHQIHRLRVSTSLREALLLLGRLLADRIGCEVDPIGNECICRLDLQQTADSFLRRCVSDNCGSHAFDVSSAVSIYAEYCTSNGYTRATSTTQTTGTTSSGTPIASAAVTVNVMHGAGVWGTTSAAGGPWTNATAATSTSEKASDWTTESTRQSVPSATLSTTTTSPATDLVTREGDKTVEGDGSKLKVGEIVGIVVGILGLIATALGRVQRSLPGFSPIGTVRPSYHPLGSRSLYSTRNTSRRRPQLAPAQSRGVFTSAIPPVLIPPVIFVSLLLGLWTWKCFWIVVMQDKLLYISWLPPFARSEQISDYAGESRPVHWEERRIRSLDGTKLAVCEGRMPAPARSVAQKPRAQAQAHEPARKKLVVICYFQGNGGSTPMRLPLLSQFLRAIHSPTGDVDYIVVALSYRGYWKSSGRASQIGIELDAVAFLQWVAETYGSSPDADVQMVLWGHSLGTAIASSAAATYLTRQPTTRGPPAVPIAGMILEAPMSSTKDMLISLYPQKWLPYRYLWPFLWNNWSSAVALERMARWRDQDRDPREHEHAVPPILLLSAEKDEVIPVYAAAELEQEGKKLGLNVDRLDVSGAMHTEIPIKAAGRQAMIDFIKRCTAS